MEALWSKLLSLTFRQEARKGFVLLPHRWMVERSPGSVPGDAETS